MLKAEYTRKINKSILMITPEKDFDAEKESVSMFQYNEIPYFLKMNTQRKNMELQFCYDITSQRSLEQLLEYKPLEYTMLQMILDSFDRACMQTEDFMLTENDIMMKPEFIFADHNIAHISYCYLPGFQSDICKQFKEFMEYLLQHLNHKDERAMQLAYGVYQKVSEEKAALHKVLREPELMKEFSIDLVSKRKPLGKKTEDGEQIRQYPEADNERDSYIQREGNSSQDLSKTKEVSNEHYIRNQRETGNKRNISDRKNYYLQGESGNASYIMYGKEYNQKYTCLSEAGNEGQYKGIKDIDNYSQYTDKKEKSKDIQYRAMRRVEENTRYTNAKRLKKGLKKAEKQQQEERIIGIRSDEIQKKETLRKQAAEKLKNMLMKKIYTDRVRNEQENTVFEAEEEEPIPNNPTVCLMPDTDGICNRFIYEGADRSRDFDCMQGKMLLGSAADENDICIPFPMISRVHAVIQTDAQGTFLEDLNSTNGTHVNGELLQYHERRRLKEGDMISLAGECYSFH